MFFFLLLVRKSILCIQPQNTPPESPGEKITIHEERLICIKRKAVFKYTSIGSNFPKLYQMQLGPALRLPIRSSFPPPLTFCLSLCLQRSSYLLIHPHVSSRSSPLPHPFSQPFPSHLLPPLATLPLLFLLPSFPLLSVPLPLKTPRLPLPSLPPL